MVVTPNQAWENPRLLDVLDATGARVCRVPAVRPKGSVGGRPPDCDPAIHKGRNVVQRFFNRIKEFPAIATRYYEHARNYRAGIVLAGIITLLRDQLRDTP